MLSQVVLRVALAAALLFAGQAALLHPLQHVDAKGGLVHVPGKDKTSNPLCDALAAFGACVTDAQPVVAVADPLVILTALSPRAPRQAEAPPFLSQGPPALL